MLTRIRALYRRVWPEEIGCDPDLPRRTRELVAVLREDAPPSWS
jgi:hypothetical protein